jgi:hypothetical protein
MLLHPIPPTVPLKWRIQISSGLVKRSLGIVVGLDSLTVFVDRAVSLAGDVKNLA